jgi:16S rRNA C967 or C1407 C5-methylase (RsmB/RsmF family)
MSAEKAQEFTRRLEKVLTNDAERREFFKAANELSKNPSLVLRQNRLRAVQRENYSAWVEGPVAWSADAFFAKTECRSEIRKHPAVLSGGFYWQEGAAVEAVEILDPRPNDWVLDLCAAPGSKSTQIAERLYSGSGWLVANEVDRGRAEKLRQILGRHGALWATVTSLSPEALLVKCGHEVFDKILIDAPCSGESLFAKRADRRTDVFDREVKNCVQIQKQLLNSALKLLKAGGQILYSTCTYSRDENEDMVAGFVAEHEDLRLLKSGRRWPHVDQVPGGYWALIQNTTAEISPRNPAKTLFGNWEGVLWSAGLHWDGEVDLFATAMAPVIGPDRFPKEVQKPKLPVFEDFVIDLQQAQKYWTGEAIRNEAFQGGRNYRLIFDGLPVGGGRGVEGRLNSYLPKGLRVS